MIACTSRTGAGYIQRLTSLHAAIRPPALIKAASQDGVEIAAKILLVDDDDIVLQYLGRLINAAGYDVVTASSAAHALVALERDLARLVILDIIMPGMDGLALCRAIRRQTYPGYIYLMMHTSKTDDADILDGFAAGADDYIRKGTPKDQMIEHIRTAQRILSLKRER